ncbi:MAG: aminotransferase class I/II-fold pyridoxal phosphate-dependent enzyme, partial [bacterium]|nr:aminotransferase class I/II-fold pyridoxal phosphate-dependent enzyme [bacterium]
MIEKLIRKNILQFQPYIPGKPIAEVKRELGLKRVIKLASNENPLGPSLKALQAVKKALNSVFLYPEGSGILLKRKIAKKLALRPSNIILGNGSDELIEIIGKTFLDPGDEIIVSADGFIRYKMAGDLMCCGVIAVPSKDHKHDLAGMKAAITPKTKVIFIINPNNPTGTYVSERELVEFFQGLREDIIVVFDEAYYEYATQKDYPQTLDYLRKGKNVIILRTSSKIYALAGLRVGYGLAGE